jgi:hypothetical protein
VAKERRSNRKDRDLVDLGRKREGVVWITGFRGKLFDKVA